MGTTSSKPTETPRSNYSSSAYGSNYSGRSSNSYESARGYYAPSAPPWNSVYSSDNTLRNRATEHSSYRTSRNDTGSSNSYNSRSATASASASTVAKPPPSATVASNRFSSTTGPKPSTTPNNLFSTTTTGPKPSTTPVANNQFSTTTTGAKPSTTPVANNLFSTTTTGRKPSSTTVANNQFSSTTTGPKPSSTVVVNNQFSTTTTGPKPSSTTGVNNQFSTTTTGPKPSSTTVANNQFSSTTTGPKPSSTVVANSQFSSTTTTPKHLYPSLNELMSSSSVPSHQVISSRTVVSKPLFSAPPVSSPGLQACKKEEPEISDGNSNPRFKAAYKKRNDCKFYYYAKCSKGDKCDFRHEPTALGSKRVCSLWKQGKCFDEHCQFRHMNLENNKNPCYWEEKRGSCQVKECPFQHLKSEDKQDSNASEEKDKKENNGNKSKVHTRRRRLRRGPIGSTSDISQLDEDEVRDSSVTQEKDGVVSLLELLQKLEEVERNLKRDEQASAVASEHGWKFGIEKDPKQNDCKYFYYSKCSKGDKCIYRHDPVALGCKMVCHDWEMDRCNRFHCKYRHMILENNPMHCCWENKAGGCQVQDCPFQHRRSKDVFEGNNEEDDEGCSEVKTENKGGKNAGNRNKNRKPKHRGGKRNRSAGRPQADKEEQSTNPSAAAAAAVAAAAAASAVGTDAAASAVATDAAAAAAATAVQGLSPEILQQIQLTVKEAQVEFQKKLEEERANAMEKAKEEHEKLANMKLEEKTKEIYEKMEGILNCSICFELFVSPVTLNCSHTFCQFCIKEWRKYDANCPLCRKYITSEVRALNIGNLIEEMLPDFSEEMKQKRENVIKLREIHSSLP